MLIVELAFRTSDGWVSTLANIGHGLEWVVVVSGIVSYAGMEGFNMLYERYVRRLDREAREKGLAEGREEVVNHLESVVGLENLSPQERLAELDRYIKEMRKARS